MKRQEDPQGTQTTEEQCEAKPESKKRKFTVNAADGPVQLPTFIVQSILELTIRSGERNTTDFMLVCKQWRDAMNSSPILSALHTLFTSWRVFMRNFKGVGDKLWPDDLPLKWLRTPDSANEAYLLVKKMQELVTLAHTELKKHYQKSMVGVPNWEDTFNTTWQCIVREITPCIQLKATLTGAGAETGMARSKWDSVPDIPISHLDEWQNLAINTPLLCQMRCDELRKADLCGVFPEHGMFYVFGDGEHNATANFVRYFPEDNPEDFVISSTRGHTEEKAKLSFESTIMLPPVVSCESASGKSGDRSNWYFQAMTSSAMAPVRPRHHLLGSILPFQEYKMTKGDALLCIIDSDYEMNYWWGECGALYYFIEANDLKTKQWHKVKPEMRRY